MFDRATIGTRELQRKNFPQQRHERTGILGGLDFQIGGEIAVPSVGGRL